MHLKTQCNIIKRIRIYLEDFKFFVKISNIKKGVDFFYLKKYLNFLEILKEKKYCGES